MRIRKTDMVVGVVGNVLNEQSDSQKDTYSCDYINDAIQTATNNAYSKAETDALLNNKVNEDNFLVLTGELGTGTVVRWIDLYRGFNRNNSIVVGFMVDYGYGFETADPFNYNNHAYISFRTDDNSIGVWDDLDTTKSRPYKVVLMKIS